MRTAAAGKARNIDAGSVAAPTAVAPVETQSLGDLVYRRLRDNLMRGDFLPHERLKVRDLAAALGTSETPVREALVQLVRDRAIEMKARHYFRVRKLTAAEYVEIRDIRLELEPLAAERALPFLDAAAVSRLAMTHKQLIAAEHRGDARQAIQMNFEFHFGIYRMAPMPTLVAMLESLWIQIGPLLNHLYPHGKPTYPGRHQHENILAALRDRDAHRLRDAIRADLIEGGRNFLRYISELERREAGME